jgi:hypothetical protein
VDLAADRSAARAGLPAGPAQPRAAAYYGAAAPDGADVLHRLSGQASPDVLESVLRAAEWLPPELHAAITLPLQRVNEFAASAEPALRRLAALAYRQHPEAAVTQLPRLAMDAEPSVRRAAAAALRALGAVAVPALAACLDDHSATPARRRRAARLLGSIPAQPAGNALLARLDESDHDVLAAILQALEKQRGAAPGLEYDLEPIRRQASRGARMYFEVRVALGCLHGAGGGRATRLLVRTLECRLDRVIQGLFALLGLRYRHRIFTPHGVPSAAARPRNSPTPPSSSTTSSTTTSSVSSCPCSRRTARPEQIGRELFGLEVQGPVHVLRGMIEDGDPWLAACAMASAAELGLRILAPQIRIAARKAGATTAAVAARALERARTRTGDPHLMQQLNIVERVIALESVELLRGLSPDQLARIAAIATQEHAPPGKVLLTPGDPLDAMYVIMDGSVELLQEGVPLEVARQNDVVGSWALLDSAPLPVTARAMEDTTLLRIAREDFYELLSDNTEIISAIFSTLVRRFRALLEQGSGS